MSSNPQELARMKECSGNVRGESTLQVFLYLLARDELAIGKIECLLDDATGTKLPAEFTNGWVAQWALDAANRLSHLPVPTDRPAG